jgi:hypothetical protein
MANASKHNVTFDAKQRPSGAWIGFYTLNGLTTYVDSQIKKSKRGAISAAKRAFANR